MVVLVTAAVSHVSAGGLLPGPLTTAALLVGLALLAAPLLRVPASAARLVVLVVGGQGLTHLFLSATAGHVGRRAAATPTPTPTGVDPVGTLQPGLVDGRRIGSLSDHYDAAAAVAPSGSPAGGLDLTWAVRPVAHLVDHLAATSPLMLLAHTVGAVAVALWLAVGEQALWHLLCLGAATLASATLTVRALGAVAATRSGAAAAAGRLAAYRAPAPLLTDLLHHPVTVLRGPPAALLAV